MLAQHWRLLRRALLRSERNSVVHGSCNADNLKIVQRSFLDVEDHQSHVDGVDRNVRFAQAVINGRVAAQARLV